MRIISPQVILTISPTGELQLELPGANGARRRIGVNEHSLAPIARRILEAQALRAIAIGEDGAPTQAQVRHWESHGNGRFRDPRCPFCSEERLAELRAMGVRDKAAARAAQAKPKSEPRTSPRAKPQARRRAPTGLMVEALPIDEIF